VILIFEKIRNLQFLKLYGIIRNVACKNKGKRRVKNIFKLKLKSKLKMITKETARTFRIMILGFILIIAMLTIKYKPVYEVMIANETLGYISNISDFTTLIEEEIINNKESNIEDVSLKEEPQYILKLITRNVETDEETIIAKLEEESIKTYKFYAVTLNGESEACVDTIEEAQEIIEKIKNENDGNGLDLDLAITEIYTQDKDEITIDTVQVAQTSLEDEIKQLLDEKEAAEAIATVNGINLSVLPVSGTITSRFGEVSRVRSSVPHTGLDIACVSGTDVKAVAKGTVIFAGWKGDYGNLVKIDHGNGVETWYAHCSKIYVSEGDEVSSGDVISAVGSTGNSTGPHLHLEIRIDGTAINPQKYLY
jgi:murein DD-endopeptidase MepM/ murein hydrolase activator NlpD